MYEPCWSKRILDEATSNLIADGRATEAQAHHMREAMLAAFDFAAVSTEEVASVEPQMTNDPKDRHVLATAVAGDARTIVTLDLKHFPIDACKPFAVEPLHPDAFLLDLYDRYPQATYDAIERQAAALTRPPMTIDELLDRLAATVPAFAHTLLTFQA